MKKFEITETTLRYQPKERNFPDLRIISSLSSDFSERENVVHQLYMSQQAREHVFAHIGWENPTPENSVEQGGILVGQVFKDHVKGTTYGIVQEAIPGKHAKGSSVYLEIDHQTWKEMLDQVDEILDANPNNDLQIIGWYHTHPNELSVFMSGTDRATQSLLFFQDWHFAIVLNPHTHVWRVFYGKDSIECEGFVIEMPL